MFATHPPGLRTADRSRDRTSALRRGGTQHDRLAGPHGAVAAVLGDLVLFVSTLLHPLGADRNDAPAASAEYTANSLWVWTHLGQFLGFAILSSART